jgi:hypothetical protein
MPRRQPSSASLQAAANAADGTPSSVRRYDSLKHSREQVKRKADVVLGAGSSAAPSMRSVSVASTRSSGASMPTMPLDTASTFGGAGNSTDPAVIQAITQTMIGEFMWKDTRRNFSKEMSGNRHKRFFWLHPYTKTLYWSSMDPGGEHTAESRAKSGALLRGLIATTFLFADLYGLQSSSLASRSSKMRTVNHQGCGKRPLFLLLPSERSMSPRQTRNGTRFGSM